MTLFTTVTSGVSARVIWPVTPVRLAPFQGAKHIEHTEFTAWALVWALPWALLESYSCAARLRLAWSC